MKYAALLILLANLALGPTSLSGQINMKSNSVGFFTDAPEYDVDIRGHFFIRSNSGNFHIGIPNNGNQWKLTTSGVGKVLQFRFKPEGTNLNDIKMSMSGEGDVSIGGLHAQASARLKLFLNSSIGYPHLLLTEDDGDYSRLSFENTSFPDSRWTIAAYPTGSATTSRVNFWFQDTDGGQDVMTVRGNGNVGIMGISPTARLHLHQQGQVVGQGLRFDDGINQDWDITHGYALRLHYGGNLRGTFLATTGEYVQASDGRLKKNVKAMPDALSRVMELKPSTYQFQETKAKKKTLGFIAQEAAPLFPELVHYIEADALYGVNYAGFSVVAIKAIQELKLEMDAKDEIITELKEKMARLEKLLTEGNTAQNYLRLNGKAVPAEKATLDQNVPNPFALITTISYHIPEDAQRAVLQISNENGQVLQQLTINQRGPVRTTVDAAELPAGTYIYSLWVDGQVVGTKKMLLQK
ncbi:tail fiber domain-containing protein [Flavilitoribacter nigricans]|uniref:Peptidase S74 domain-containing protein n=1 Tax=Flavilitoribacter nigricans (strain ATCC 23147 / DSM 23189 / NBRC 102662 / NCIMB 1420 / SS-2) TaxID=1122177 RepID=A0A2D0NFT5_FLAN2|nr:tail fiber domain-containing protein [Flavilitoribacter nigricans]PHN07029.1 hypothetical protein CRP01_08710 [Flavilitoribacter nigricans DSM 23189 = NBRC 102662]